MRNLFKHFIDRTGRIFEWSLVQKAQFIYNGTIQVALMLAILLVAIEHFEIFMGYDLDSRSSMQLILLCVVYIVIAIFLTLLGFKVRKRDPDSEWYTHIAIQVYIFSNILALYYLGLFSLGAGVALAGGPIAGMILFPPRIIFPGVVMGFVATIVLTTASSFGVIPYAPLLIDTGTAHLNVAWLMVTGIIVGPHLVLIVGAATVSILRWQEREQRVQYLSCTDVLTNVANRRHLMELFDQEVERCIREKAPLSFMMMDLDHFKNINDTYGHQTGDQVIKVAAQVLKESTRKVDHVGRYGGEEFACILPNTTREQAMLSAERCRDQLEKSVMTGDEGEVIAMTCSIGVDTFDPNTDDETTDVQSIMEKILRQADQALYVAKESGRNRAIHIQDSTS